MLKLYNTLTRKKEVFKPIKEGEVGIYSCGPTVYNYAHIGNLRFNIDVDLLKRAFLFNNYKVKHVMNITDVDDKTIKGSKKEGMSLKEFTRKYEKIFLNDLQKLNIITPGIMPRATEHINEMVAMIKILLEKEYAYKAEDGIYFSVEKFKDYGKLANLKNIKTKKSRIKNDEYDKDNIQDFALWKFYTEEDGDVFWETEIGKGRPGWHIECSAMSQKYLGSTMDIHMGAIDLIFPHHTNKIAQSEAASGKKFVNYWIHPAFLTMKEGKMSKSIGNVYYLKDLAEKKFLPLSFRYLIIASHYRTQLLFDFDNLQNSQNSYQRLKNIVSEIKDDGKTNEKYLKEFEKAINDDLNTPEALQVLWNLVRDEKADGKIKTIEKMDSVFGLDLLKKEEIKIPAEVQKLIDEREKARKEKNFKLSDELRDKIKKLGYRIDDAKEGMRVSKE
jgi:cysteinyl-tRNA synthetase